MVRPRFPTLQERLSLVRVSGPSGEGTRQAVRTMNVLSSNLDRMSDYFFKKAEAIAEIEGAEFGAKNPITEEELKKQSLTDDQIQTRLGDTTTVFGRASRKASLAVLETELELSAKRLFSKEITKAITDEKDADDLAEGLDAITLQYSKLANDVSPILGQRLTASLNTTASSKFHEYSVKQANESIKKIKAIQLAKINLKLDELPIVLNKMISEAKDEKEVLAILDTKNKQSSVNLQKFNFINALAPYAKNVTTYNTNLKKFDDQVAKVKSNYILSQASIKGQEVKLARAVRNNNMQNVDYRIKAIVSSMTVEEKLQLNKNLINQIDQRIQIDDKEDKIITKENEGKISDLENKILQNLGEKNRDLESARNNLTILKTLDRDKYDELFKNLVKVENEDDPEVKASLFDLADRGVITIEAIRLASDKLTGATIDKLRDQYIKNQNNDLKLAKSYLTSKLNEEFEGFNPAVLDNMQKKNKFLKPMAQYKQISFVLENELDKAIAEKKEIDLKSIVDREYNNYKNNILDAQKKKFKENANTVLSQLKQFMGKELPQVKEIQENQFLQINNFIIANKKKLEDKLGEAKIGGYEKTLEKVLQP
tara:strand:+ start:2087 stop:3880 length:1794 start_codon:yes stop_codon:yes gene_type:complete